MTGHLTCLEESIEFLPWTQGFFLGACENDSLFDDLWDTDHKLVIYEQQLLSSCNHG